jgi:exo-beta-1,3-glucanase (GH17 family)
MTVRTVLNYKRAICYSGFRDGQSPDAGIFPTKDQIASDLRLLQADWDALRLYACDLHAERVLAVIEEQGFHFKVMLGAYIAAEVSNPHCPWGGEHAAEVLSANKQRNQQEIERAVALANRYPGIVDVVSAGNEATVDWTDHLVSPEAVTAYVAYLQQRITQPVTFCENYVPWLEKLSGLAEQVDVIAIHTYPVWEYKTIDEALAYTQANYAAVRDKHPGKQVIITEAGWATASNGRGIPPENVGEFHQKQYLEQLYQWAAEEQILIYVFEAFDENWKGSDHPLEPEKHWGLYRANRQPKLAMA